MTKEVLKTWISQSITEQFGLAIAEDQITVEQPTLQAFGDYTSNIALTIVKLLPKEDKQSPMIIAEKLVKNLQQKDNQSVFSSIQFVAPGFINFTFSSEYLCSFLKSDQLNKDISSLEQNSISSNQKILVEHTGPNTNKPLHIGHIRNAILGNSIINILKKTGHNVFAGNINNDRGIHIIKSMYGYLIFGKIENSNPQTDYNHLLDEWTRHPELWKTPESMNLKSDHFVGHFYVLGNTAYEDSEKAAIDNNSSLPNAPHLQMQQMLIDWEAAESRIRKLWQQNNDWCYKGMHQTLKEFGVSTPNDSHKFFDTEWYESDIYREGKDIILEKLGQNGITEFEDGHVEAVLEKNNLPNVVLLRKNKTSLYITQDIELMRKRIKEDQYDQVVILTDASQNLRFQQLFAVCQALDIAPLSKMKHLGYGTVLLPEGRMSSRKGTVIHADNLIAEVVAKAKEKINEERSTYTEDQKDQISKQVAISAIKYGMLRYNSLSNITFDIENSISFEGDTGPYIQYTHARACSILTKYSAANPNVDTLSFSDTSVSLEAEESVLVRTLHQYLDVLQSSAKNDSPNYLCEYLFNLAQKFNHFYTTMPIIGEKDVSKQLLRLRITHATIYVLKDALSLLGIQAPEQM
jgi:arginyl-tRNA synthetase